MRLGRSIAGVFFFQVWLFIAPQAQVAGAAAVSVFVADGVSGAPLVQARVEFPVLGLSQHTDMFGVAYFPRVLSGMVRVKVSKIGYVPIEREVTLEAGPANAIELTVAMTSIETVQSLDTVKVTGSTTYFGLLSGFEYRRKSGLGKFFTSAQLDSSAHVPLADLISRRVTGLRAEWAYGRRGVRLVSLRGPISISQPQCFVQVYVDNNKANDDDLANIQSGDVAGVEYYAIAPPVQYGAASPCGTLLVWTRR